MFLVIFLAVYEGATSQPFLKDKLYSKKTLLSERQKQDAALWKYSVLPVMRMVPDSTNESQFQSALWAISQFMLKNDTTRLIVDNLVKNFDMLQDETKSALMEVLVGLYPKDYNRQIKMALKDEGNEKIAASIWYYLARGNEPIDTAALENFANSATDSSIFYVKQSLLRDIRSKRETDAKPALNDLFANQKKLGVKVIYSLQRKNRDYPGIAIMQLADGSFVKNEQGEVKTFVQLARSASNLPYYLTNGNTPQGIFRIAGTGISKNQSIGPTPNLQLRMPNEVVADSFFIQAVTGDYLTAYQNLLPYIWRNTALDETFFTGKCGRTEIIAHGSTINPAYFKTFAFYPNTPTLGCLCAKETWDPSIGKLVQSDQLDMVNAFLATPGSNGYLIVVNLDDTRKAVSNADARVIVKNYESSGLK